MDNFIKNCIILLVVCTALMCVLSYIGYISGAEMGGTDAAVEETAAETRGLEAEGIIPSVEHFGDMGEYVGFTLAGIVGGFIFGYFWIDIKGDNNA